MGESNQSFVYSREYSPFILLLRIRHHSHRIAAAARGGGAMANGNRKYRKAQSKKFKVQRQDEDLGNDDAPGSSSSHSGGHPNVTCVHAIARSFISSVSCDIGFLVGIAIVEAKRRRNHRLLIACIGSGR